MVCVILIVAGLILGSFVNALTWRLHEQGKSKKSAKSKELSILKGHSMCPNCRHRLAAKDLVPVFSWVVLRGRCRYCRKKISWQYPLVELATAGLFVFSYYFWPVNLAGAQVAVFVLWLAILTLFVSLTVYDARWHVLPNKLVYPLWLLVAASFVISLWADSNVGRQLLGALWGVLILAGLFYVLFQVSKGKWIGGGDVKLAVPLGVLVGGPLNAVLLLFLASCGGTLYALPFVANGKAGKNTKVPYGPFLILAAVVTRLFGASIVSWYKGLAS